MGIGPIARLRMPMGRWLSRYPRISQPYAHGQGTCPFGSVRAKGVVYHKTGFWTTGQGSLISISTPAGKFNRISMSMVFASGSMMSIKRLCVRISKCS